MTKQDLRFPAYEWNNDPQQILTGVPTRRAFDRRNGHQVLLLINYFASMNEEFTIEKGRHVEERIMNEMPDDIRSELSAYNWIRYHIVFEEISVL